ncbi:hypothetical protein L211DRAFT_835248 [Terfezia boudieri ATCC MYA-4762]|uniref:Uncharacterized protein n=1 Tax=Terfezia boudieri ATCC MYA-4762 TaxID=1051890 RepID=A0A3N4LVI5_9PEZI|nr:hypothetical protein L211DRAFT_835248 [Terfezia boudieri ATCC MYA-4762]
MAHTITDVDHLSPIHEAGFSYSFADGFNYQGIQRQAAPVLRELFGLNDEQLTTSGISAVGRGALINKLMGNGVDISGIESLEELTGLWVEEVKRVQEMKRKQGQKMTKKELTGQLRLYGIDFKSSMSLPKLRELLVESIKAGKCDEPKEHIKELESNLKQNYDELDKVQVETIARKRQEDFDQQYPTTGIAAIANPKMFISRHFLALDGTPDSTKSPDPIIIYNLSSLRAWHVEEAALVLFRGQRYSPGNYLYTRACGPTDSHKVLALGWNRMAVWDAAGTAAEPLFEKQAEENEKRKQKQLEFHRRFVSMLDDQEVSVCNMKTIQGKYLITCKDIENERPSDVRKGNGMSLRIMPEVGNLRRNMIAEFHFAVMEGLMRLRPAGMKPSRRRTEDEIEENKRQEEGRAECKIAQEWKEDDSEETPDSSTTGSIPKKRKAPEIRIVYSKKWSGNPIPSTPEPNKFRLDFDFRGRATGEGVVDHGTGWIEWDKHNSTTFEGMIDIGFIGSAVPFYGYKTGLLVRGTRPDSEWNDYFVDPYEM